MSEQQKMDADLRQIVTEALVSMISGVTGLVPPSGPGSIPDFVQAPIDRAVERISASLPVGVPDGWKMVPVEPTPEMINAAEESHMPFGDMDIALRMAILSAPAAQPAAKCSDERPCIPCYSGHGKCAAEQSAPGEVELSASRAGRVYLAGPMTGYEYFNFPAFNAEAARLRATGLDVVNPAEHGIVEGAEWGDYLRYDIAKLVTCEAIHFLPGWEASKGARLEHSVAKALGMPMNFADGAARDAGEVRVPVELAQRLVDPYRREPRAIHLHNEDCDQLRALLAQRERGGDHAGE